MAVAAEAGGVALALGLFAVSALAGRTVPRTLATYSGLMLLAIAGLALLWLGGTAASSIAGYIVFIAAAQTDHVFRRPAQQFAEERAALGHTSFMYWFTWASPAFGGILGSAHALDIPFAFDNLGAPGIEMLLGDGAERQGIATRFADEIAAFSATGAPSWPAFDADARATLRIDTEVEVLHDPEPALRLLNS